MNTYTIFGGSLRSELEFPSLRPAGDSPPTWTLRTASPGALPGDARLLGADTVEGAVRVHLYRSTAGWHLLYDDTGRFDVAPAGDLITWRPLPGASAHAARLDVMGRVLAIALHAAGDLCFHASAVTIGGTAMAFLGSKGMGKSTIAWALVRAGAKLITDDTLRVCLGAQLTAYPGVHELRLRPDVATHLPPDPLEARFFAGRLNVHDLTADRLQHAPAPLEVVYLLEPIRDAGSSVARSVPIRDVAAALSLVRHAKIAPLLGGSEAAILLDRAVTLTRHVSIRVLEVPRDLGRLDAVVGDVISWHSDLAGAPAA
jgi:hypothetical protein